MSIEQMGPMEPNEDLDPRIEEILSYYGPEMRKDALEEWEGYSEAEKERLYSEFMKDHKKEAA